MRLNALDEDDRREFEVRVAGPSALLVAKLHKLADRSGQGDAKRLKDKDALDVLRLLRAIPVERLAQGQGFRLADGRCGAIHRPILDRPAAGRSVAG